MGVEVDYYILKRIESVVNSPLALKENKEHLLHILRACVKAIKSDNDRTLADLKSKLARHELIGKEIAFTLDS